MNRFDIDEIYIVAEIGQNHNGNIETAKSLIDDAALAGCSAVKLAKRDLTHELTDEAYNRLYDSPNSYGKTYGKHREFLELTYEEHKILKKYTNNRKMDYFLSVCDIPSLEFTLTLDPPLIKIPSKEINNIPLLEKAAECDKPVAFSIGMGTRDEVFHANKLFNNPTDIIVITTSQYPTELDNINMKRISSFVYERKVGFSCHYPEPVLGIVAAGMGVKYIEYHITTDQNMKGSDHSSSLELDDFAYLVDGVDMVRIALGEGTISRTLPKYLEKQRKKLGKVKCEDGIYRIY